MEVGEFIRLLQRYDIKQQIKMFDDIGTLWDPEIIGSSNKDYLVLIPDDSEEVRNGS